METCNEIVTFVFVNEILWCDHSNETSLKNSKFQFDLEFEGHRVVSHIRLLSVTFAKQSQIFF